MSDVNGRSFGPDATPSDSLQRKTFVRAASVLMPLPQACGYLRRQAGSLNGQARDQGEPRPELAIPDCPPELSPAAQREWARLVAPLGPLRVLTHLDRAALAAYCAAYALWAESTEAIQKYGAMVKSPTGFPIQSPYVSIANRQAEIMMRVSAELGFTPASRGRISVAAEPERTLFDDLAEHKNA